MMCLRNSLTRRIVEIKRLIVFVMGVRNLTANRMTTRRTAWPARRMVVFMVIAGILQMIAIRSLSSDIGHLYTSSGDAATDADSLMGATEQEIGSEAGYAHPQAETCNTGCSQSGSVRSCTVRLKKDPLFAWLSTNAP